MTCADGGWLTFFGVLVLGIFALWLFYYSGRERRHDDAARLLREKRKIEVDMLSLNIEKQRVIKDLKLIDGLCSVGDIRNAQMQLRRVLTMYAADPKDRGGPVVRGR